MSDGSTLELVGHVALRSDVVLKLQQLFQLANRDRAFCENSLSLGLDPSRGGTGNVDVENGDVTGAEAAIGNLQDVVRQLQGSVQEPHAFRQL